MNLINKKDVFRIITSYTALYRKGFIDFNPQKIYIERPRGGNNSINYSKKYNISTQYLETFYIGVEIDSTGDYIYCTERLFIELKKFDLPTNIYESCIKQMKKVIDPWVVKKLYSKLKKRTKIDKPLIEEYIKENTFNILELIKTNDLKDVLREFILYKLNSSQLAIPIITKGGSAIEVISHQIKRSTNDADLHTSFSNIDQLLKILGNSNNEVYFTSNFSLKSKDEKSIFKLKLYPRSKTKKLQEAFNHYDDFLRKQDKELAIPISINTMYDEQEIKDIMDEFNLPSYSLKILNNFKITIFSKEMLLGEKFFSLITKPETSKRVKDLIDLGILMENKNLDQKLFYNWYIKKAKNRRKDKLTDKEAIEIILKNKDKKLLKIEPDFDKWTKILELTNTLSYESCLIIYRQLADILINKTKNKV